MKYYITTFGCQMNKSDSERITTLLEKIGYKKVSKMSEADLFVVNMCSVRQSAVDRVYGLLPKFERLKKKNKNFKTVLTGCIVKKDKQKFTKKFNLILGIKILPQWPKYLKASNYKPKTKDYLNISPKHKSNFSAFIPISNGCDNFCTYCVVPYTRGRIICRSHREIIKEAKNVIKKGFKEIWLLGQNVNDYQSPTDSSINFAKLLKKINDIPGNFWIRFTSSNPKDFSNELIDVMAKYQKVTDYLNLPVQSGDNEILKKMNRPYTTEKYKKLVKKIREKIPEICLSTDIIVGFPEEIKKQFENTVKLFKEIKFDMAYIAKYSPRPQTAAFNLKDSVSQKEKERRWKKLSEILKETALKKNQKYIGKELEVLIEKAENGFLIAKTKTYKTVKIPYSKKKIKIGSFIKVKIIDALSWGLKGKLL
ncbi:tRNA (N6-isopentenyl adenosine(37)-C2)-methylthiotransferase MiaB [Patescibacteria group bacterium]